MKSKRVQNMPLLVQLANWLPKPYTRWGRLFPLSVAVGIAAGTAAAILEAGIHFGSDTLVGNITDLGGPNVLRFEWLILLLPAFGGLIAGTGRTLLSRYHVGHGVDFLTRAFHQHMGKMGMRGPVVNAGGATLVISCGGSAGPEGPIAVLGAAFGAAFARLFPVTPRERRILLIAGCAAGVGAIFRCPLGGALFATSILYSEPEFESDAMVPSVVASVMGYSTYILFRGFKGPMLTGVSGLTFSSPVELLPYIVLGPLCGLTSIFFYLSLKTTEKQIGPGSKVPQWLAPAIGGLGTGALACALPQIMDGRYVFIQNALHGQFLSTTSQPDWWYWTALLGVIVVVKCIATGLTVGSGAPGGVLGPSVFIGGAVGAFLGFACEAIFPGHFPESLRQALIPVGMGGVLAASMRIPLAAIVMITEMTGSYGLIAPLMFVCVTSYVIGRHWGLNDEQVRTATDSPAHAADHLLHVLEAQRVQHLMEPNWPHTVPPEAPLDHLVDQIALGTRPFIAVAQGDELKGVITATDLGRVMDDPTVAQILVASDVMTTELTSMTPEDDLYHVLTVFRRTGHGVLPVITQRHGGRWVGMISRQHVMKALRQDLRERHTAVLREHEDLQAIDQDLGLQQMLLPVSKDSHQLQRLFVPIQAVGKSLRESDFRRSFDVQVVAIEHPDGSIQCPPDLNMPLTTNLRLLVLRAIPVDK